MRIGVCLLALVATALGQSSEPTPQDVISSLMGTWIGTITLTVNGKTITQSFTETITQLGTNGLGYQSVVTIDSGNKTPASGISYQYDNGELDGATTKNGKTTAVFTGTWYVQNSTIYGNATAQEDGVSFTENTQTFVTGQTLNSVVSYSFGGSAVGTALKVTTPSISFSLPNAVLAFAPKETFLLDAASPSLGGFTYSSSDPTVVSIKGNTATILGVGTATITVSQAAKANYTSSTASAFVTVNQSTPLVTFITLKTPVANKAGKTFALNANSSSGAKITFTSSDPTVISVTGNRAKVLKAGTVSISASVAATKNYTSSVATQTVVVE